MIPYCFNLFWSLAGVLSSARHFQTSQYPLSRDEKEWGRCLQIHQMKYLRYKNGCNVCFWYFQYLKNGATCWRKTKLIFRCELVWNIPPLRFLDFILTTGHMLIALANMTRGIPERNGSRNNNRNLDYTSKLVLVTGENLTDTSVLDYESAVISLSDVNWDSGSCKLHTETETQRTLPPQQGIDGRVLQTVVIIEHEQAVTDWAVLINQVFLPHRFRANKPTGLLKSRPDLITTAESL